MQTSGMFPLTLDVSRSEARVFTGARGLLSPMAHDLELRAVPEACVRTETFVRMEFPVDRIRVVGAVRAGVTRTDVLSSRDAAEVERRIAHELFGASRKVMVSASVEGLRATLTLSVGSAEIKRDVTFRVSDESGAQTVRGECSISLKALGVKAPRGPLGAFEVADAVRVTFCAVWV